MQAGKWCRRLAETQSLEPIRFVSLRPRKMNFRLSLTWRLRPPLLENWSLRRATARQFLWVGHSTRRLSPRVTRELRKRLGACCRWAVLEKAAVTKAMD